MELAKEVQQVPLQEEQFIPDFAKDSISSSKICLRSTLEKLFSNMAVN
jgi:hypothetical protein